MSAPLRDAWCGESLAGHMQGLCHCQEIQALRQQLATVTQAVWEEAAQVIEGYRLPDGWKMARTDDLDATTEWLNRIAFRVREHAKKETP